jgi:hypothetical protein
MHGSNQGQLIQPPHRPWQRIPRAGTQQGGIRPPSASHQGNKASHKRKKEREREREREREKKKERKKERVKTTLQFLLPDSRSPGYCEALFSP